MLSLNVVPREDRPLTDQIVMGVKRQIDDRQLRPGTRLPSIRNFAETHGVSRFTVVEAYDRLVAMGCLQSRRGAGFYVAARSEGAVPGAPEAHQHNEQLVWLIRRLLEAGDHPALAGGPWLPNSWLDESGIRQALSALARKNGAHLLEYGNPFGYLPLREHLALTLADIGIAASPAQILLTQGTSQALDLVMRYLLQPGDCALVDDPGYYNMFGNLRMHGVEMLAVPRRPDGPDLAALEALAAARRPKVYFTQSAMQNPTGSSTSPHVAFRLLRAAESHDFTIVEDDIFCDLQSAKPPRTRDARPAQSRHLCEELLEDPVGKSARRIRGLDAERGRRARRHQNADLHHDVAIHRTPALPHPCGRSLPKTLVAATGASRGGAGQCRAGFRANWTRNVYRADRRNVHLGAAGKHR